MGWTKLELVGASFEEIGLAGYEFDLTPAEQASALHRMDAMFASWADLGIHVGYLQPDSQAEADLNAQSGVYALAYEAAYTNLALRLAPTFGKTPSQETKRVAKASYDTLLARMSSSIVPLQLPGTMPSGAGNRRWRGTLRPFLNPPSDPITTGKDGDLEFN